MYLFIIKIKHSSKTFIDFIENNIIKDKFNKEKNLCKIFKYYSK